MTHRRAVDARRLKRADLLRNRGGGRARRLRRRGHRRPAGGGQLDAVVVIGVVVVRDRRRLGRGRLGGGGRRAARALVQQIDRIGRQRDDLDPAIDRAVGQHDGIGAELFLELTQGFPGGLGKVALDVHGDLRSLPSDHPDAF